MLKPGDVVVVDFPGAIGTKTRPAVVLSTSLYHTHRPDVIVGLLTTNIASAIAPTDYVLQDWTGAGLRYPSAYRSYLITLDDGSRAPIGHLSDRDWQEVQARLKLALAVP